MYRVDLHTHSEASIDGGITADQYAWLLENEELDIIAITDHSRIDFALGLQKALGKDKIIVGEEIMTSEGEIIGLFLNKKIEDGATAKDTIALIKKQDGLVYIPHPFEKIRNGLTKETLDALAGNIDIIELYNGRAITKKYHNQTAVWAKKHGVLVASSSDAHGVKGIGKTFTGFNNKPVKSSFMDELSSAHLQYFKPPLGTFLYPKLNRFFNMLKGRA